MLKIQLTPAGAKALAVFILAQSSAGAPMKKELLIIARVLRSYLQRQKIWRSI